MARWLSVAEKVKDLIIRMTQHRTANSVCVWYDDDDRRGGLPKGATYTLHKEHSSCFYWTI